MMVRKERRKAPRNQCNQAAIFKTNGGHSAWVTSLYDVSEGGCSILAPNFFFNNEILDMIIYDGGTKRHRKARIKWVEERSSQVRYFMAGCEFL